MKFRKPNNTVLNAEDKFGYGRDSGARLGDLTQLGERAVKLLNDKNLKVSKVKPFFWSMVEAYVDRFQIYPFDINRALISYLELKEFPEDTTRELIEQLETRFEEVHGRPLRKSSKSARKSSELDDEIKELRDSLKYAALVAESESKK